jgi:hypothetical protein
VIAQCLCLGPTMSGQTGASGRARDHTVEACVGVTVSHEDETHHRPRYGQPREAPPSVAVMVRGRCASSPDDRRHDDRQHEEGDEHQEYVADLEGHDAASWLRFSCSRRRRGKAVPSEVNPTVPVSEMNPARTIPRSPQR